ncbi:hypothetical protein KSD_10080 [Ktedonobacter sp. SOSP1-85]|nr:hypothetical protein KSD_10080 [Ktedonobacter sp. SOSP1-85]
MLLGLGIDAYEALDGDLEACFFQNLAADGLLKRLSKFHAATGQVPPVDIAAVGQEDLALAKDQGRDPDAKLGEISHRIK